MPEADSQHRISLLVVAAGFHKPGALILAARRHGYEVTACTTPAQAAAWAACAAHPLVVVAGETAAESAEFCRALRLLPNGAECEVLAMCDAPTSESTALLLAAGATDVLATSAGDEALGVRLAVLARRAVQRAPAWAGAAQAEAEALLEATATLGVQADPEDVIRELVEHAVKLLDAEIGTYAIAHDDNVVVSTVFQNGAWLTGTFNVPLGRSIAGLVWRTGVPYRTNDLAHDPHTLRKVDRLHGLHSQIVVPLSGPGDRRLGLLALANSRRADGFSERDERLLIAFCEYGSLVLTRARDAAARLAA
ncbi:MAG: GAF domain-containing protein, partial [Dehalococcoidia bacterium]